MIIDQGRQGGTQNVKMGDRVIEIQSNDENDRNRAPNAFRTKSHLLHCYSCLSPQTHLTLLSSLG